MFKRGCRQEGKKEKRLQTWGRELDLKEPFGVISINLGTGDLWRKAPLRATEVEQSLSGSHFHIEIAAAQQKCFSSRFIYLHECIGPHSMPCSSQQQLTSDKFYRSVRPCPGKGDARRHSAILNPQTRWFEKWKQTFNPSSSEKEWPAGHSSPCWLLMLVGWSTL